MILDVMLSQPVSLPFSLLSSLSFFFFFSFDEVSLYTHGFPGSLYVDQTDLKTHRDLPAFYFLSAGVDSVHHTTPGFQSYLYY